MVDIMSKQMKREISTNQVELFMENCIAKSYYLNVFCSHNDQ